MRILYLGLPLGALRLAAAGHAPAVVCIGHPDAPGMRRLRRTLGARGALLVGRPDLDDDAVVHTLSASRPDAILSWFWPRRIPDRVLALAPRGAFGVHPSLLPRWRGPDPYFWALRAGDATTGVTLHRLAADYDTGAVIARREIPIDASDDAWRLARKLDRPSLALLAQCAERLARGDALAGEPQDESLVTHAPEPDADALAIDWRAPADEIVRLVRAAAPSPGATALLEDTDVEILRAHVFEGTLPRALVASEAMITPDGFVVVRAGDGAVALDRVRAGDEIRVGPAVRSLLGRLQRAVE